MDGLLLDTERLRRDLFIETSSRLAAPVTHEQYSTIIGLSEADARSSFEQRFGKSFPWEAIQKCIKDEEARRAETDGWPLRPLVTEALQKISQFEKKMAVATSTLQAKAVARLTSAQIHQYFDTVIGRDEVSRGKPFPDLFLLAAQRLSVPPAQCIVLEDAEYGAQAAIEAGMNFVIVPDLKTPPPTIAQQALGVFDTILSAVDFLTAPLATKKE